MGRSSLGLVLRSSAALVIAMALAAAFSTPPLVEVALGHDEVQPDGPQAGNDVGLVFVAPTDEEAELRDASLAAAQRNITVTAAMQDFDIAESFGAVQVAISSQRPELYAGAAIEGDPSHLPTLYIRGLADSFVKDVVADAGMDIKVVENRPLSWLELEAESIRLHEELLALGYESVTTSFDEVTGTLEAALTRGPEVPGTPKALRDELTARFRNAELTFIDNAPQP